MRESNSNSYLFSVITNLFVKFNFNFNKTLKHNKKGDIDENYVDSDIAAMFGNIPQIKEDFWIIVIDEIERAQFNEIYRVIEVIERFKNEASFGGLPVKIVFFLCLSGSDLQKRIDDLKTTNEKAFLINDFFFKNPKSYDKNLFLPPIPYNIKEKFVYNALNKVLLNEFLKEFNLVKITNESLKGSESVGKEPKDEFFDEKRALKWILEILVDESPRMIGKLCQELEFFYYSFKNLKGEISPNSIEICDVITISYIKIKYPILIEFFKKGNPNEFDQKHWDRYSIFNKIKDDQDIKNKNKQEKYLQEIINKELDREVKIDNTITNLVAIVSYRDCNLSGNTLNKIYDNKRTSNRYLMWDVLCLVQQNLNTHKLITKPSAAYL